MDDNALVMIRSACRPLPSVVFDSEVYDRRNKIIMQVMKSKRWTSERDKYEVLCLIITYWMHGSHLQVGLPEDCVAFSLPNDFSAQPELAGTFVCGGDPSETPVMSSLMQQIQERLPHPLFDSSSSDEFAGNLGLCETCDERPMFEGTAPECLECYREH